LASELNMVRLPRYCTSPIGNRPAPNSTDTNAVSDTATQYAG
jgi:hypothetical protein